MCLQNVFIYNSRQLRVIGYSSLINFACISSLYVKINNNSKYYEHFFVFSLALHHVQRSPLSFAANELVFQPGATRIWVLFNTKEQPAVLLALTLKLQISNLRDEAFNASNTAMRKELLSLLLMQTPSNDGSVFTSLHQGGDMTAKQSIAGVYTY